MLQWSFSPAGAPIHGVTVRLLEHPSLHAVHTFQSGVVQSGDAGSLAWDLSGGSVFPTGAHVVEVTDGVTRGLSAPFVIANFSATVALTGHPSVVFRWFNASAEVQHGGAGGVPGEASVVDVRLCVNRTTGGSAISGSECPWVLASGVELPASGGDAAVAVLQFGGAVGAQAPGSGVFSMVVTRTGTLAVVGEGSGSIEVADAMSSGPLVSNLQGGAVFCGYGGWEVSWEAHAAVGAVLGSPLVVLRLERGGQAQGEEIGPVALLDETV